MSLAVKDRRDYWKRRYETKRAAGQCVTSGCANRARKGKTLCAKHAERNRWSSWGRKKERRVSERERLPEDRTGTTAHFTIIAREEGPGEPGIREVKGYITANTYPDGRLGEIFVRVGKAGSSEMWLDMWAMSCSIALQRGATVDELFGKFIGQRFEPSGYVKWLEGVPRCTSVVDMVSRFLINKFGAKE